MLATDRQTCPKHHQDSLQSLLDKIKLQKYSLKTSSCDDYFTCRKTQTLNMTTLKVRTKGAYKMYTEHAPQYQTTLATSKHLE